MSTKAVDYAWGRPSPGKIKSWGASAALRYLSTDYGKSLSAGERQALHAAGLGVGVVWETTADRALSGAAGGQADGVEARRQALACGFPPGFPIFAAVDFDPTPSQYQVIADYLRAGGFEVYGNAGVCAYMVNNGVCSHTWQMDWHRPGEQINWDARHIHQLGQVTIDGVSCDVNDVFESCCLWFPSGQVHIQSVPSQEEDMYIRATDPKSGNHAMCDQNGNVTTFNPDGTVGGIFLGTLVTLKNHLPNFNPLGPVAFFGYYDDHLSNSGSAYVMVLEEAGKAGVDRFHPVNFPSDGRYK